MQSLAPDKVARSVKVPPQVSPPALRVSAFSRPIKIKISFKCRQGHQARIFRRLQRVIKKTAQKIPQPRPPRLGLRAAPGDENEEMAKSLDDLVDHLISSIAVAGIRGTASS